MSPEHESEDLPKWKKAFVKINKKLGNDVWGIRQEFDGVGGSRLRVYINDKSWEDKVLKETNGFIDDQALVFTVYSQKEHAHNELNTSLSNDDSDSGKVNENAEGETSTCRVDGNL